MIRQMYPPIPTPDFSPNFTGYDLNIIDWYKAYEQMAQTTNDAIFRVSSFRTYYDIMSVDYL